MGSWCLAVYVSLLSFSIMFLLHLLAVHSFLWMSTPTHRVVIPQLLYPPPSGHLGCFRVLVTVNKTTRNIQVQILCGHCLQRSGAARSSGKHMFKLIRSRQTFSKVTVQLCISISLCQRSSCLTAPVRSVFSILAILTGVVESHWSERVFLLCLIMYSSFQSHSYIFLGELSKSFAHF